MALRTSAWPVWVAFVWHLSIALVYGVMRYQEQQRINKLALVNKTFPGYDKMGERYKYLTQINLFIQLFFFSFAAVVDVASMLRAPRNAVASMRNLLDGIFTTVAFPLAEFIVCIFWPIYIYDRELIFPSVLDEYLPAFVNYVDHLGIGVFVFIEMLLVYHEYPLKHTALAVIALFSVTYMAIVFYIAHYGGFWVYPFMRVMSPVVRVAFFAAVFSLVFVIFYAGKAMSALTWGDAAPAAAGSKALRRKKLR